MLCCYVLISLGADGTYFLHDADIIALPPSQRVREAENVAVPEDLKVRIFDNVALIFKRREATATMSERDGSVQEETSSTSFLSVNNDVLFLKIKT